MMPRRAGCRRRARRPVRPGRVAQPVVGPYHRAVHVYLETDRLILRRFTPDDLDDVTALDADPAVMRYINGGRPTPRDQIRDDVLPAWLAYYERGDRYGFWAAIEQSTGAFLGWFHLRPLPDDPDDDPELGYRLNATTWGQGYASEGTLALIDKAFETLGVRRVHASTMVVNVGSWRVMEKAGLRHVRTFHQPWPDKIEGDEQGDVEYALTRDEWQAERDRAGTTEGGGLTWEPMTRLIETERLTLRIRDERDAVWYRELVGERGQPIPTLEESSARLARLRDQSNEIGIGALAICRRVEGDTIGYCALIVGRATLDEPEIAYELLQRFHGHGYATEATQALVAAAAATGRHRLWSTVGAWNTPSSRVLEKLGFRRDHTVTDDRGEVVYLVRDL